MEIIFSSFFLVAASEMGDKTQLLAFILASRFRKPWAVFSGILVATILNHLLASTVGTWVSQVVPATYLKWGLALTFIGFGLWMLVPDDEGEVKNEAKWGAFLTTTVAFFLAEMGDKTQLATVALAARFQDVYMVTLGTTLGMMFSDGLAVFVGDRLSEKISLNWMRKIACGLFILFGVLILVNF